MSKYLSYLKISFWGAVIEYKGKWYFAFTSFLPFPVLYIPLIPLKFMLYYSLIIVVLCEIVCVREYVCVLNLFIIAHLYKYLEMTPGDWITYQGTHPWQRMIFPLTEHSSPSNYRTLWSFPLFPSSYQMVVSMQVLFRWTYLLDLKVKLPCPISMTQSCTEFLVLWLLQSSGFSPTIFT